MIAYNNNNNKMTNYNKQNYKNTSTTNYNGYNN